MIGKNLFDPLAGFEHLGQARAFLAEGRDDRLVCSMNDLRRQPQRGDVLSHVFDLSLRRIRFHDHDHGCPPSR